MKTMLLLFVSVLATKFGNIQTKFEDKQLYVECREKIRNSTIGNVSKVNASSSRFSQLKKEITVIDLLPNLNDEEKLQCQTLMISQYTHLVNAMRKVIKIWNPNDDQVPNEKLTFGEAWDSFKGWLSSEKIIECKLNFFDN